MPPKATTAHPEIRDWAELHSLVPVEVLPVEHDSEPPQLAFATVEQIRGDLRQLAWRDFFALFDIQDLALVYDDGTDSAPTSFYELVHNQPKSTLGYPLAQA